LGNLIVQQIQDSHHLDGDLPASRQVEAGPPLHHTAAAPRTGCAALYESKPDNPHLRSMEAVIGHRVHAIDDFLINDDDWNVRFVKVDTRNRDPTQRALLPPRLHDPSAGADALNGEMRLASKDIRWVKE
jgi:hypothetical protein